MEKLFNVDSKLDGVTRGARTEVVLPCLQTLLPGIEVHRGHLGEVGLRHVHIETLRLADVRSTSNGTVEENFLGDLPNSLIEELDICWDALDLLDTTVEGEHSVLNIRVPKTQLDQIIDEVGIHADELTSQYTSCINIRSVRLKAFIVS